MLYPPTHLHTSVLSKFQGIWRLPLYHAVSTFVIFTLKVFCFWQLHRSHLSIYSATDSLALPVLLWLPTVAITSCLKQHGGIKKGIVVSLSHIVSAALSSWGEDFPNSSPISTWDLSHSLGHGGRFWQLPRKATPVDFPIPKPGHTNSIDEV